MRILLSAITVFWVFSCVEPECASCGKVANCTSMRTYALMQSSDTIVAPYTPAQLAALADGVYVATLKDGSDIHITLKADVDTEVFDGCGGSSVTPEGLPWELACENQDDSFGGVTILIDWDRTDLPGWEPLSDSLWGSCRRTKFGARGELFAEGRKYTYWPGYIDVNMPFLYFDDRDESWHMCSNGDASEIWADSSQYYGEDPHFPAGMDYVDVSGCLEMVKQP